LIEFKCIKLINIFFKFNFTFLYIKIDIVKTKVYFIKKIQLLYPNKQLKCKIFQLLYPNRLFRKWREFKCKKFKKTYFENFILENLFRKVSHMFQKVWFRNFVMERLFQYAFTTLFLFLLVLNNPNPITVC